MLTYLVESCFERATEFIPERWYTMQKLIKNKNAYSPFALGLPSSSFWHA